MLEVAAFFTGYALVCTVFVSLIKPLYNDL